jgi:lambda repressor-like predicted transcriptional regulator
MPEQEIQNIAGLILEAIKLKGLTLDKLSQLSGVSERALALILEERFDKLPSAPYIHGYLIKIAEVLNLDGQKLWQEFIKNNERVRRSGQEDILPPNRFAIPKLNKKITVASIIAGVIIVYLVIRLPGFLGRPELDIENLSADPTVVLSQNFTIRGIMNSSDELTINGEAVYPAKDGSFEKNILLQSGFNSVVFQIKKLLGKTYTVTKQIFYQATSTNGKAQ